MAIVVGILAGYASIGFRGLIGLIQNISLNGKIKFDMISMLDHGYGWGIIFLPAIGISISAILVHYFAKEAKGHGVPEVIDAVLTRGGVLRSRVIAVKTLASSMTIALGGSAGREGPIVQIGSAMGSVLGQFFKLKPKILKILVGCGAAAAIAASFNTPVGGVIFAIEVIVLEFKTRSFVPLVIAAVMATVISRVHIGNDPAFDLRGFNYVLTSPVELIFYVGLGIICGFTGVFFTKIIYGLEDFFDYVKVHFIAKAALGGLLVGVLGYFYPEVFGVGYDSLEKILRSEAPINRMLSLVGVKMLAVGITLAAGGSGGVFSPSLFIGAMVGGSYGYLINKIFPGYSEFFGAYALVAMAALFAASCRATFTAIVILFEMTLDYELILPLMLVCVIADQVATVLSRDSIYSLKLKRKGVTYRSDLGINILAVTKARDIMTETKKIIFATPKMSVKNCYQQLLKTGHPIFPVLDEAQILLGFITSADIHREMHDTHPDTEIIEVMQTALHTVYPNNSILDVLKLADTSIEGSHFFVIESKQVRRLHGIISGRDVARIASADE